MHNEVMYMFNVVLSESGSWSCTAPVSEVLDCVELVSFPYSCA